MPWAKLDDGFTDHPKIIDAGPLAGWLFVCGLTYSARLLTDGFVPQGQVRKLADVDNAMDLASRLVEVGLWERTDGGFRIHDYLEYNPSAAQVKDERKAAQERMRRVRSREVRPNNVEVRPNEQRSSPARSPEVREPRPVPSRPTPVPVLEDDIPPLVPPMGGDDEPPEEPPRDKRATRLPKGWALSDELRTWTVAAFGWTDGDVSDVAERFADYWHSVTTRKLDWDLTWKNWARRENDKRPKVRLLTGPSQHDEAMSAWLKVAQELQQPGSAFPDGKLPKRVFQAAQAIGGMEAIDVSNGFHRRDFMVAYRELGVAS